MLRNKCAIFRQNVIIALLKLAALSVTKDAISRSCIIWWMPQFYPFEVSRAGYSNNGCQDITATLNGTVNGGKTYFNQSSQELIPNGSTVTEKGRIRDRFWSARRGKTCRQSVLLGGFFPETTGGIFALLKTERCPIFPRGEVRGLLQVKFDDGACIWTSLECSSIKDVNSGKSSRCDRDTSYQAIKRNAWGSERT